MATIKKSVKKTSVQGKTDASSITISITLTGSAFLQALSNPMLAEMYAGMLSVQQGKK